jgi:hypothetical protein
MSNFIVVSPSQTTNGGASGDLFVFRSGAGSGAVLAGGLGGDTVQLLEGGSAKKASLKTEGGADLIQISAVDLSASSIFGGAGGDTITFSGASNVSTVKLGAGSDLITLKGVTDFSTVEAGAGADNISGASLISASGASILMGAGRDTVTFTATEFQSATLNMGGGADSVNLNVNAGAGNYTVKGGAGADTLTISAALASATINLGDGSDQITYSGAAAATGAILGGAGADNMILSGSTFASFVGGSIGGGAGKDTINVSEFGSAGSGAIVFGGGGNDSITLSANKHTVFTTLSAGGANFSAGNGFGTIHGGAGADSITFSGQGGTIASAGIAGVIGFSALSESTESNMDVISFSKSAGVQNGLHVDFAGTLATAVAASNKLGAISLNANGFLVSAGNNSSVSERISAMNSLTTTGQVGIFKDTDGSGAYLFVQGGSTDLVAKFDVQNASAGTVTLSAQGGGAFKVHFA